MSDPIDIVMGAGIGGPVIGLLVWGVTKLGTRSVTAIDTALTKLAAADAAVERAHKDGHRELLERIDRANAATQQLVKDSFKELSVEIRHLRDTDIGQAKDIGYLQSTVAALEKRINGQGAHYQQEFDKLRRGGTSD